MNIWPHAILTHSTDEIAAAVSDPLWQAFRQSLKGQSTSEKLRLLEYYRKHTKFVDQFDWRTQTRIDNYINALLRGGQLCRANGVIVVQR